MLILNCYSQWGIIKFIKGLINMKDMEIILNDVRNGKPIIIVDSLDRENEGDFMIAAEMATAENLAMFCLHGRGIMCLPCKSERLERLKIPMMPTNKLDKFTTPFANSIDAAYGVSTGVSVHDRLKTIRIFLDDVSSPNQLAQPGHLFPLRARDGLLNERQGHTEAGVALCELAGLKPVAVICEIMNEDGTMSRLPELTKISNQFNLNIVSIDRIIEYFNYYEKMLNEQFI